MNLQKDGREPSSKLDWNCEEFFSMWIHCNSWRNKFHEYYVQGEWPSCEEWKVNHQNCELWKTQHDRTAKVLDECNMSRLSEDINTISRLSSQSWYPGLVMHERFQAALIHSEHQRSNAIKYDSRPVWKLRTEQCSDWKTQSVHCDT